MTITLGEIAELVGGRLVGRAEQRIERLRTLAAAGPDDLSFVTGPRYRDEALASDAGALLVLPGSEFPDKQLVEVDDPHRALAVLLTHLHPPAPLQPGVHETAVVGTGAAVDATAFVGPYAVLGEGASVGPGAAVHPHAVVGAGSKIGRDAVLHAHVVVYPGCSIGERSILHSGVVVGSDGFGYATEAGKHGKIPQVGGVEIGEDVEIGANSTVDRASLGETRIGDGTKIDNLVQVGHSVEVGAGSLLVAQSGIAGSTRLGRHVVLAGQSGVAGHLEIGDGVRVAAKSAVFQSVPAGSDVAGVPAVELAAWRRQQALVRRLAEMRTRLRRLEERVARSEGESADE